MEPNKLPFKIFLFGLLFATAIRSQTTTVADENVTTMPNKDATTVAGKNATTVVNKEATSVSSKNAATTVNTNVTTRTDARSVTPQAQFTHLLIDVSTTDVCGLSLVSPNSESHVRLQKCRCSNLNEDIDCSYLDVSELPKLISFPKTARNVNFLGNRIENIADDTFYNGRNVLELDLSHNHIDFISSVAFKAFRSLRDLDLSHNKIWNLPSKSFQGLTELRYLDLGYNDLVSISSDLFSQTNGLKELILEANPLQELEPKLLENLPNLEVLSLESTLLRVIPDHLFHFTPHLKLLDLSNNQLTEVPSEALIILDHLKVLELSGNPISVIKPEAFLGLRGLILLYLDRMPVLTKIEKYAFGDLLQLQELHCSYNFLLTEVDEHAFVRKVDNTKVPLSQLFLRQNSLETIPKELLNWNDNIELYIVDNPLYCDCHVEWMVNMKIKNEFQSHVKCNGPSYLSDLSLSQLKNHSLSCGLELSEIVIIAIAIVVGVIIIVLIAAFLIWRRSFSGYTRPYFKVKRKNIEDIDYSI